MAPEAERLAVIGVERVGIFAIFGIPAISRVDADDVVNCGGGGYYAMFVAVVADWVLFEKLLPELSPCS